MAVLDRLGCSLQAVRAAVVACMVLLLVATSIGAAWWAGACTVGARAAGKRHLVQAGHGVPGGPAVHAARTASHETVLEPLNACLTGTELRHFALRWACRTMWQAQTADIDEMRHDLERHFGIADYQPFSGLQPLRGDGGDPRGEHGGSEPR